jgi:hypothetical protein
MQMSPLAASSFGPATGAQEAPPAVDPSQFAIQPPAGPEVNNPMPTPAARPSGVMPMMGGNTPSGPHMLPPAAHQAINRLRGFNPARQVPGSRSY